MNLKDSTSKLAILDSPASPVTLSSVGTIYAPGSNITSNVKISNSSNPNYTPFSLLKGVLIADVPINLNNFDDWRKGEMQVSLAGPLANLITAFVASIFFALCFKYSFAPHWLIMVLQLIIIYNVNFAIFNLVPIPPLDGSKILSSLLPGRLAYKYQSSVINRYSFFILIALVFTGILGFIIHPISNFIISILNLIISIII